MSDTIKYDISRFVTTTLEWEEDIQRVRLVIDIPMLSHRYIKDTHLRTHEDIKDAIVSELEVI